MDFQQVICMELNPILEALQKVYPQWDRFFRETEIIESLEVDPAANDGQRIYYNSRRFDFYTPEHRAVLLAREVLHVLLAHEARRQSRDPELWARATEAVANELLRQDGFSLPADSEKLPADTACTAEAVYAALAEQTPPQNPQADETENDDRPSDARDRREGKPKKRQADPVAGNTTDSRVRQLGDTGLADSIKGLSDLLQESVNLDYDWFSGTTIRDGILKQEFRAYPVPHAEILLDTSYSVDAAMLRSFVRACKALMRDAVISVGCFDTKFYGFQEIRRMRDIETMTFQGGGGTNFDVAIHAFTGDAENQIIFTDGYGPMPEARCDAIWVVYGTMKVHPKGGRVIYVDPYKKVYASRDEKLTFAAESQEWLKL